jgi:hypothetical protein
VDVKRIFLTGFRSNNLSDRSDGGERGSSEVEEDWRCSRSVLMNHEIRAACGKSDDA